MPIEEDVEDHEELQKRDVERVEAFSDGVFAFAVTLMVLAIRIPRPDDPDAAAGLQHLLLAQWPSYVALALSFTVVGTVWANHRLAFGHLVRSTHVLVSLNLVELMAVAFLPLPITCRGGGDRSGRSGSGSRGTLRPPPRGACAAAIQCYYVLVVSGAE